MSRRFWIVLMSVATLLVIAPRLPQWLPAALGWLQGIDFAATVDAVEHFAQAVIATIVANPQIVMAIAGGALGIVIVLGLVKQFRARQTRSPKAKPAQTILPSIMPAQSNERRNSFAHATTASVAEQLVDAPAMMAPIDISAADFPPIRRRVEATSKSGRGSMVRRLSADGLSLAEISRRTRVGQDGIRIILARPMSW